jgi:uncharacterized protein (TIGR02266 family)
VTKLADKIDLFRQLDDKREKGGLDALEEERWLGLKDWLERAWAAESESQLPPSSRRSSLRVPLHLEIEFKDARGFERAYLRNISTGGVYIATQRDLRMGDRFHLNLTVDEPYLELELPVEVVWENRKPSPQSGLEPGVGVCWIAVTPEQKAAIKQVVRQALADAAAADRAK